LTKHIAILNKHKDNKERLSESFKLSIPGFFTPGRTILLDENVIPRNPQCPRHQKHT
jgi:hypothetical protein